MPIYEYECQACHREFEYQQRMSDPDKTVCEACGGALERLISRTAFQLKGSGWYKDLYASAKPAESKPADAKTESKPDAGAAPAAAAPSTSGGGSDSGSGSGTGSSGSSGTNTNTGGSSSSKAAASAAPVRTPGAH